jgi:mono/diheme cytochrome c family protein
LSGNSQEHLMQARTVGTLVLAAAFVAAGTARAQDIAHGKAIADIWCSNCHRVGAEEQRTGRDTVPPFSSIARMQSTTAASLAAFLSTTHGGMPNLALSRREIRDVSAYILSLRAPH